MRPKREHAHMVNVTPLHFLVGNDYEPGERPPGAEASVDRYCVAPIVPDTDVIPLGDRSTRFIVRPPEEQPTAGALVEYRLERAIGNVRRQRRNLFVDCPMNSVG